MAKTETAKGNVRNEDGCAGNGTAQAPLTTQNGGHADDAQTHVTAPSERRPQREALRDAVPLESHAGWKAAANRCDPPLHKS
jgi:hypothetical protein